MKKETETQKRTARLPGLVLHLAILAIVVIGMSRVYAADVCEATLDCPANYSTDTLKLPANIVSLAKTFKHCSPTFFDESVQPGNIDTISLFFVIDHSGSMSVMDSSCIRYQLTANLIDSLTANSPASEVGIAIFSNQLLHSVTMDSYAQLLDPSSGYTDAYIPLTKLNTQVAGQSASAYLKSVVELSPTLRDGGGNHKLVNGYYGNSGRHDGHDGMNTVLSGYNGATDITLAFDAARKAFQSASNPKNKQYIIFLSDGEPQYVDFERAALINDFVQGTNLPTTFTAYWVASSQAIPQQIVDMTANIQNNNYSTSNNLSTVWKTQGDINELLSKLLNISSGKGFSQIASTPKSMTINGVTTTQFVDSLAVFPNSFALQNPLTTLDISFTYHYDFPMDIDSTRQFKVYIKSMQGAQLPADITTNCWAQGTIRFYVNGQEYTGTIPDEQKNIEVRYYPAVTMTDNQVLLHLVNAASTDSLQVNATKQGSYYTATITRETGTSKIDNLLQTSASDSVIALYQNSLYPLDIVREGRPIGASRDLAIREAYFLDQDADGFADVIRVTEGGDKLTAEELATIKPYLYFTSARAMTIQSLMKTGIGFDIVIKVSDKEPNTGVGANERLGIRIVSNLSAGGTFPAGSVAIADSMAPVISSAQYRNGATVSNGAAQPDTLSITFSEKTDSVAIASPFRLYDHITDAPYSLTLTNVLSGDGLTQRFIVTSVNGKTAPESGDLIRINETASVSDIAGNIQDNAANRRVPLQFTMIQYTFTATAGPTPADPQVDVVPSKIINEFPNAKGNTGVVVIIKAGESILSQDSISSTISIYDQVGNVVVKDDRCVTSTDNGKMLYLWNGTNRNGRLVGDGTYVAIVKVKVTNGVSRTVKTKIGILHK